MEEQRANLWKGNYTITTDGDFDSTDIAVDQDGNILYIYGHLVGGMGIVRIEPDIKANVPDIPMCMTPWGRQPDIHAEGFPCGICGLPIERSGRVLAFPTAYHWACYENGHPCVHKNGDAHNIENTTALPVGGAQNARTR